MFSLISFSHDRLLHFNHIAPKVTISGANFFISDSRKAVVERLGHAQPFHDDENHLIEASFVKVID